MPTPRQKLNRVIDERSTEYFSVQIVWLGNYSQVVLTGTAGVFYARQANGKVIKVFNSAGVPPTFDLQVKAGVSKSLPGVWQIIGIRETYTEPAAAANLAAHHEQHEFPNFDTVWVDRKQILYFTVLVSDAENFIVSVYGGVGRVSTGLVLVEHQTMDLSSYVVTAGAKFISIETDESGTLSANEGTAFGSPAIGTVNDIPSPGPGQTMIAAVLMYEGQSELSNNDILVPMPLGVVPKDTGLQIDEAAADTPLDADEFGFWDVVDSALKKITWANIKAALETYFDTLYSALGHTHAYLTDAPSDGQTYGRKDAAWTAISGGSGHLHGMARWNGASGQTTFDLPDIWEYIDSLMLNGLEEDPFVYTLSADGTQIILDSALGSDTTVTAHGVIVGV